MIVEQALYGEVKGGHGLRAASGDVTLARELSSRLDLPDTSPPGADWSPYISGFPYGDRYIVARTFRDANASRAGMVLSHALILSLNEAIENSNLNVLFALLITSPIEPKVLETLSLGVSQIELPKSAEIFGAALALVTRGFEGPVVRVGHDGFEELIASLWTQLWPSLRRGFSFRLSFGPGDLVEDPLPSLVCTPSTLIARWQRYRLLDRYAHGNPSGASKLLSGENDSIALRVYAESIGANITKFDELPLLEQGYRYGVQAPDLIGNTLAAIRLTERLSPDSTKGERGKGQLINHFVLQVENAAPDQLLPMRNLQLDAFADAIQVWEALTIRVATGQFLATFDKAFIDIVGHALADDQASEKWRKAVLLGLKKAAGGGSEDLAAALWRWVSASPENIRDLWPHLVVNKKLEEQLVKGAPDEMAREAVEPILAYAEKNRLYQWHGTTAAAGYAPVDAVRRQAAVEPHNSSAGIKVALRRASPEMVIECTLAIKDERLIPFAGAAVAQEPSLLAKTDMSTSEARAIWAAALKTNRESWGGPSNPQVAFFQILGDFLRGDHTVLTLVELLASSPLADLTGFSRRSELWPKLSNTVRNQFIDATTMAWLRGAASGCELSPVEPMLESAILRGNQFDMLICQLAATDLDRAVHLIALLEEFDEMRFRGWLRHVGEQPNLIVPTGAEALGRIVLGRVWNGAVADLLSLLRRGRADMLPALRSCAPVVGIFDRIWLNIVPVTPTEKWDALVDVAAELYPTGPDHDGLWERAGGRGADLGRGGNGRSRWREALVRIRNGGVPKIGSLLGEMRRDYSGNNQLRYLATEQEFGNV